MKLVAVLVMDDGVTWSTPDGSSLCLVTVEEYEALADNLIDPSDLNPVLELVIRDHTVRSK